jgi:hypothetical protein
VIAKSEIEPIGILRTVSAKSEIQETARHQTDFNLLLNRLSFSHFIELLKIEDYPLKRSFYETETIKNNWSVRELQRSMNSMFSTLDGQWHAIPPSARNTAGKIAG